MGIGGREKEYRIGLSARVSTVRAGAIGRNCFDRGSWTAGSSAEVAGGEFEGRFLLDGPAADCSAGTEVVKVLALLLDELPTARVFSCMGTSLTLVKEDRDKREDADGEEQHAATSAKVDSPPAASDDSACCLFVEFSILEPDASTLLVPHLQL